MKVAIMGAGKAGQFLYDEILNSKVNIDVVAFIDNFVSGEYRGIPIFKPENFFRKSDEIDAVLIAVGAQKSIKAMVDIAKAFGVENMYMLQDIAGKCRISPFTSEGEIIPRWLRKIKFSKEKPTLPYFEVPVTDKCNLNCKGCLFACNGISDNEHIAYEQIEKDALRMSELFEDVPWIRILGGEPLMHPRIMDILVMYRKVFPDSEIDLCTNGLLIPKLPKSFFHCLQEEKISIHISGYKPTYHILDKMDEILRSYGLYYTVLKREKFAKYYTYASDNGMEDSYYNCMASGCHELYDGRLLRCSAVIAFEKFNRQFHTAYVTKEDEDWFNIHSRETDAWKIKERIDNPSQICRYCDTIDSEEFEWDYARADVSIDDYIKASNQ